MLYLERHVARLCRDGRALGLPELDAARARRALCLLAARCPARDAAARLALSLDRAGALQLEGHCRPLEPEAVARSWSAISAAARHPGAGPASHCKSSQRELQDAALARARAAGADEALLFDAGDRLVEGARSNLCAVLASGELRTPPLARGAVAGIAREILLARMPELVEGDLPRGALGSLRELIALNALRGALSIRELDGARVGTGRVGPWARRLAAELAAEAEDS